jgi:spermidine synthase
MLNAEKILYEGDSKFEHYQVIDMVYIGRQARVLFSGHRAAAQSGIPKDGNHAMLFDYNQRFLELTLYLRPQSILLIGGGAFTLPTEILKFLPNAKIDVVERDPDLKKISERYFELKPHKNLNIFFGDGRRYLELTNKNYDLILIDAFVHSTIPASLSTLEFVNVAKLKVAKKGVVAVNIISTYHGSQTSILRQHYATYSSGFRHVDVYPADKTLSLWISQNFLQIATNRRINPKYKLRFEKLNAPQFNDVHILHD